MISGSLGGQSAFKVTGNKIHFIRQAYVLRQIPLIDQKISIRSVEEDRATKLDEERSSFFSVRMTFPTLASNPNLSRPNQRGQHSTVEAFARRNLAVPGSSLSTRK